MSNAGMGNIKERKLLQIAVGLLLVGTLVWYFWPKTRVPTSQEEPTLSVTTTPTLIVQTPAPTPTPLVFTDAPPSGHTGFFEKLPILSGQQGYVAYPQIVDPANPPTIIMYYHGSTQKITKDFKSNQVMKDMRAYGAYMTKYNFAFLASNQHGDNWGSAQAVNDSEALIAWVRKTYPAQSKIVVLGFSMGGMPAMKHVLLYPTHVSKIALLAPANQVELFKAADFQKFKKIPMAIWHGTSDVNVPYSVTQELMIEFAKYKIKPTLHTLKGKTHWNVDTEYMVDIEKFFSLN